MIIDLVAIAFLVVLEGLLSFDNALALAAMVRHLPAPQQKRALTYGMAGAFAFRFLALTFVTYLIENPWLRLLGGSYLLYLAASHFLASQSGQAQISKATSATFWVVIVWVELTDIAFSMDSILAAVALSSKLWVVCVGGILGIITMRFVAGIFIGLIERFPKLEHTAFVLVAIVGIKMVGEAAQIYLDVEWVDFENGLAVWVFWCSMGASLVWGFRKERVEV